MKIIFALVSGCMFISCWDRGGNIEAPMKLKGIPEKAFWIGGPEGGNWYEVKYIHPHKNNAVISVYNDNDGSLILSKRFVVICNLSNPPIFIDNLKDQITGFDGEKIYLKSSEGEESCYMK